MEATQLLSSPFLSRKAFYPKQSHPKSHVVKASEDGHERDYWGSIVDQNMIVLRKRIREINIAEKSDCDDDDVISSNWMEWEKKYYEHYNQDICEAMGLLQNYLLNIRPSLALGTLALVTFSVLISSGVLLVHALKIAKGIIISGFHLSN